MYRPRWGVAVDSSRINSRKRQAFEMTSQLPGSHTMPPGASGNSALPIARETLVHDFITAPTWKPLEAFTQNLGLRSLMMYMGRECHADTQEPCLFLYKHCVTRRYLYLNLEGESFELADGHYRSCAKATARQRLMA